MYTVVFVDGQPLQIKTRFMKAAVFFSLLCNIIASEMLTIKKNLIKILISTGNQ